MLKLINADRTVMLPLINYSNMKIERALEYDDSTLSFSMSVSLIPEELKLENYIQTMTDEYVIKSIDTYGTTVEITASINKDELEGTFFESFITTEQTIKECMQLALAGTGWTVTCDLTKKRTVKVTNKYVWDIIKQVIKTYRVEIKIDSLNKNLTFVEQRGEDRGVYFTNQLNLKKLSKNTDTADFYTRLIPVGKDGLTIESVNAGKKYIENYQYSKKIRTFYWKDERYTIVENLKEDAEAKLNDMSKPYKAYTCDVIDLANAGEEKYEILSYSIGDTVTLIDTHTNTREKQRIVKITEYPEAPENNTCEVANTVISFDEYSSKYEETAEIVDNITTDNGTVDGDTIDSIDAAKVLRLDEVIAGSAKFVEVNTQILNVSDLLQAANSKIGTLEVTKLTATDADLKYATIENLTSATGRIETLETNALTAGSALIHSLTSDVANINTLMFGTASGGSLTTEFSNSVVSLIGDAQVKSAMIKDITADKITSGKLYTNLVEVVSQSGNLSIADNTIQIKDDSKVARVQIGKDAAGDYNMYVWDKSGNLMFDALGLTADGIQREIIRNDMVSENANISAKKLDITSLFTVINGSTETIKAGRIYVDADNQTLDIAFKQMSTDVQTATTKADSVYSLAESANTNASSALAQVNTITETVSTQGTQLTAVQGQISSKIWQQDITTAVTGLQIGIRNYFINNSTYWANEHMDIPGKYTGTRLTMQKTIPCTAGDVFSIKSYENVSGVQLVIHFCGEDYTEVLLNSGWDAVGKTFTAPTNAKFINVMARLPDNSSISPSILDGIKIMIFKGDKATEWIPAVEDTDSSIAALEGTTTTLSNQYTSLNQSLTSLTAAVNSNTTTISTKADGSTVTTLQNNITALQADLTGFKSTVSESYTTKTEFNNVKVGGRNIFLNTATEFVQTGANKTNQCTGFNTLSSSKCNGKEVTISFDWKAEGDSPTGMFYIQFSGSPYTMFAGCNVSGTNKSGHYVRTFTIPANGIRGTMVRMDNFVGTLTIYNAKLEEGNKATDWTPAPEDYTTALNSAIEQTSSSILQTVSATYATAESVTASLELKINKTDNDQIVSMLNASADVVKIKANRFELSSTYTTITKDGAITCNSLTANGATINGVLTAGAGSKISDFSVKADILYRDQGDCGVGLSAPSNANIAIWAGTNSSHIGDAPFKVYYDGSAYIGGWNMNSNAIYYDYGNYRTYIQHPTSADSWVFSTQNKVGENEYQGSFFIKQSGFLHATEIEVENSLKVNGPIYAVNDAGGKRMCITSNNAIVNYWQPGRWNIDVYIDGTYAGILPLLPTNTINPSGKPVISNSGNQIYTEWNGGSLLIWVDSVLICSISSNGLEWLA